MIISLLVFSRSGTNSVDTSSSLTLYSKWITPLNGLVNISKYWMTGLGPGKAKQAQENSQTLQPTRS